MLFIKGCILFSHLIAKMTAVNDGLLNREVSIILSEKSYNYRDVCKESISETIFHSHLHYDCDFGTENNKPFPSTNISRGVLFNHMPTKTIYSNYGEIWFESRNMMEQDVQKNLTGKNIVAAPERLLTLEELIQYGHCLPHDVEIRIPADNSNNLIYSFGEDWAVEWLKFQGDMNAWEEGVEGDDEVFKVTENMDVVVASFNIWVLCDFDQLGYCEIFSNYLLSTHFLLTHISSHTPYFVKYLWNSFSCFLMFGS